MTKKTVTVKTELNDDETLQVVVIKPWRNDTIISTRKQPENNK